MSVIQELFTRFAHIGHATSRWNPKMKQYLFGKKNGVHIFDLDQTAKALEKAKVFLKAAKLQGHKILFVGTKPQTALILQKKLEGTDYFSMMKKWQPGLLSNFTEIRQRIDYYKNLKQQFESGSINKYTKKEISRFKKELVKLDELYKGVAEMQKTPGVVVVLDAVVDSLAVEEASRKGIGVIAVVDSNANPEKVNFPIPMNDDAIESIDFVIDELLGALKSSK